MTKIKAFRAIRPTRDKVHLVASRAVATYKHSVLEKKLKTNSYSFIHIIHPDIMEEEKSSPSHSMDHLLKVKRKLEEFKKKGIFIQEQEEALYIYRQSGKNHSYIGIIGGASIQEYKNNQIKKHEATITSREEMFTQYLDVVGFNAEPVLLSYKKNIKLEEIITEISLKRPEYEFSTTDRLKHELWIANPKEVKAIQSAFQSIKSCYIADGHHRSASSVRLLNKRKEEKGYDSQKNYNYFLSFFIEEERLNILPFHRLCKSLNGNSITGLLQKIERQFKIKKLEAPSYPKKIHDIHLYLDNQWYQLRLKEEMRNFKDAASSIDAELLTQYILSPLLNIHDLKTDENISFIGGENKIKAIEQTVNDGVYKIGFLLYPVTVEQLKSVSDEGAIMPPKSTWIEPKMRSGLTIYKIDE